MTFTAAATRRRTKAAYVRACTWIASASGNAGQPLALDDHRAPPRPPKPLGSFTKPGNQPTLPKPRHPGRPTISRQSERGHAPPR